MGIPIVTVRTSKTFFVGDSSHDSLCASRLTIQTPLAHHMTPLFFIYIVQYKASALSQILSLF